MGSGAVYPPKNDPRVNFRGGDLRSLRRGPTFRAHMTRADVFGIVALVGALAFQIWVTLKVRRSSLYEASEKQAQTRLIWMVPVLGALISFAMLEKEEDPSRDDPSMRS